MPIILHLESKKYKNDAIKKFTIKEKEGLLKEIVNSNSIEKSKEIVNFHYDNALNSLSNVPESQYSKALKLIIKISRNRI